MTTHQVALVPVWLVDLDPRALLHMRARVLEMPALPAPVVAVVHHDGTRIAGAVARGADVHDLPWDAKMMKSFK